MVTGTHYSHQVSIYRVFRMLARRSGRYKREGKANDERGGGSGCKAVRKAVASSSIHEIM